MVLVNSKGRATPREVRLGWKDGLWSEVASGLTEGEEVFVDLPETWEGKTR
jgi:hypothetical protein